MHGTGGFRGYAIELDATPEAAANLGELDQAVLDRLQQIVMGDRKMRWSIVQRGFWVHGVDNLHFLRAAEPFIMDGRAEQIRCPTLLAARRTTRSRPARKPSSTRSLPQGSDPVHRGRRRRRTLRNGQSLAAEPQSARLARHRAGMRPAVGESSRWRSQAMLNRPLAAGHEAVHAAAAVAGEAVAAVHGAAVVPDDQIADLPPLGPGELVARGVRPELVQQRLALFERQRRDVGAEAAPEEQRLAPGLRDGCARSGGWRPADRAGRRSRGPASRAGAGRSSCGSPDA